MHWLKQSLAIGFAGFFGAVCRHWITTACRSCFPAFPMGTLLINVGGSFLLGWFSVWAQQRVGFSDTARLAIATGFVGAFTTFSTLTYDSDEMLRRGHYLTASVNLIGSLLLGMLAVRMGFILGRR